MVKHAVLRYSDVSFLARTRVTIKLGVFGFGYCAKAVAKTLVDSGGTVFATSRTLELQAQYTNSPITVVDFNANNAQRIFDQCNALLITTPPNEQEGDPVLHYFHDELLSHKDRFNWIGYLSSTGVYGDHQGQWVDEQSPSINPGQMGLRRLKAENSWASLRSKFGLPIHIFRIAGIYGPYRCSLDKIKAGKTNTIFKPEQFFSRIHVDDLAMLLCASLSKPMPGEIFNLSDDQPSPIHSVEEYAAHLLNRPPLKRIPLEQAELSPRGLEFFNANKQVCNQKIKQHLAIPLKFSSYRDGLKNILQQYSKDI